MEKNKEIHFYAYYPGDIIDERVECVHSYFDTERKIQNNHKEIHTTQLCFLTTNLFAMGYRVLMHEAVDDFYEITLGSDNTRTNRDIRMSNNLLAMWRGGVFMTLYESMVKKDET